jgi:hypothetical protein
VHSAHALSFPCPLPARTPPTGRFDQPGAFVGGGYAGAVGSRRAMTRAYQAHIQSLAELDGKRGYVALPDAGAMGTNKAFIGKGDGSGLRGTSKLSGFGTDAAFMNKADGAGQSTKARTQSLYQESFEQVRRCRWMHSARMWPRCTNFVFRFSAHCPCPLGRRDEGLRGQSLGWVSIQAREGGVGARAVWL